MVPLDIVMRRIYVFFPFLSLVSVKKDKYNQCFVDILCFLSFRYSNFLHASRVEISKLKMSIEGSSSGNNLVVTDVDNFQPESLDKYKEEINKLQMEVVRYLEKNIRNPKPRNF